VSSLFPVQSRTGSAYLSLAYAIRTPYLLMFLSFHRHCASISPLVAHCRTSHHPRTPLCHQRRRQTRCQGLCYHSSTPSPRDRACHSRSPCQASERYYSVCYRNQIVLKLSIPLLKLPESKPFQTMADRIWTCHPVRGANHHRCLPLL
jgi:hypothetical protein